MDKYIQNSFNFKLSVEPFIRKNLYKLKQLDKLKDIIKTNIIVDVEEFLKLNKDIQINKTELLLKELLELIKKNNHKELGEFIIKNKDNLIFNNINIPDELFTYDTPIDYVTIIDALKFNKAKINKLNTLLSEFFTTETIEREQLCVNSEQIRDIIFNQNDNIATCNIDRDYLEKTFFEFLYNNENRSIRKGAMSFTTCHTIEKGVDLNLGCNYNVSLASAFYGVSDLFINRILLFRTKLPLTILKAKDVSNDKARYNSELIYTKIILGDDYDKFNFYNTTNMGFKGCAKLCLPQKFIYFFIDLYNEERYLDLNKIWNDEKGKGDFYDFLIKPSSNEMYPPHYGLFISDTPTLDDRLLKFKISGIELRIYNAHRYVYLDRILIHNNFYKIDNTYIELLCSILINSKKKILEILEYYNKGIGLEDDTILRDRIDNFKINKNIKNINYLDKNDKSIIYDLIDDVAFKNFTNQDFNNTCIKIQDYCIYKDTDKYKIKYMKYKQKYLSLKKMKNQFNMN